MLEHQFGEEELDRIVAQVQAEVDEAWEFAAASPLPDPAELRLDVLEEEIA